MKINTPVTQTEIFLEPRQTIVSKTDLKGVITYVNHDFLEISGFSERELIGQSHNIVRHPDMPPEAFADLWMQMKAGRPWTGLVKNRCKNGDYYWVLANATPVYENDVVIGYMSVRSAPPRERVEAAENAYQKFREGKASGLAIREGRVVNSGLGLGGRVKNLNIGQRVFALFLLFTVSMLLVSGFGIMATNESNSQLQTVYIDRVVPLRELKQVADAYAVSVVDLSHKTRDSAESFGTGLIKLEAAEDVIKDRWKAYASTDLTEEEKVLVAEAESLMHKADSAIIQLKNIFSNKDRDALAFFAAKDLYPAIDPISDKLSELVELQLRVAKSRVEESQAVAQASVIRQVLLISISALFGLYLAIGLVRGIRRPIEAAAVFFRQLSEGRSDLKIESESRDELTAISDAARIMQIKSGFDMSEARRVASEAVRIKIGLDNVVTNVMIADTRFNIIYMNRAIHEMFANAKSDIEKDIPQFKQTDLLGSSIDIFHKNPAHQRAMLDKLSGTHRATIRIGGRTFVLTVNPVVDIDGARHGYVVEWVDRTMEEAVEDEVAIIVSGASHGDFSQRLSVEGKAGFFLRLANDLNMLVQTSEQGLDDVVQVLSGIAEGDLTRNITAEYRGTFGQLKDDSNQTVRRLTEIISKIRQATASINRAAREIASGNQDLSRRTEEQANSLEEAASSMEQLSGTVKHNAENALKANELASNAQHVAVKGGEVVGLVVQTMSAIHQSSSKIADIIGVIDGIAFQTNILALNAAVEAARAGEQGRGFAVVATEVRNLAQRSANAAKEIKGLISDSMEKVEIGNKQVAQAGQTMVQVVSSIQQVARIMADIAHASREQSAGIEQVSLAVSQMDEVTQQNAALVEQAAAAAESLEEQADSLVQMVSVFKLSDVGGVVQRGSPRRLPSMRPTTQQVPESGVMRSKTRKPVALPAGLDDNWKEF